MNERRINVLQVNADNFDKGGISTIIFRFMENLNNSNISFGFFTDRDITKEYKEKIRMHGGKIEKVPKFTNKINSSWLKYKYLKAVLQKGEYDIVHINGNNALALSPYIFAAKVCKSCKIVVHAHTTRFHTSHVMSAKMKGCLNHIFRKIILENIGLKLACSREAAQFMFSSKDIFEVHIIKNGLDSQKYRYIYKIRTMIRSKMEAEDKVVIGHIGRFSHAKNHEFLIELFTDIKRTGRDAELWLIGDGQLENDIRKRVHENGLDDDVKFIGTTNNIQAYLCGMDVMVFPSRYEGLPLVLVEAQANDLPIVCSDTISEDTFFGEKVTKCSLNQPHSDWINEIEKYINVERRDVIEAVSNAGFDIKSIVKKIEDLYDSILS